MKYETIDKSQIADLMARIPVKEPEGWNDAPVIQSKVDVVVKNEERK
jgi:cell division protease FtsH